MKKPAITPDLPKHESKKNAFALRRDIVLRQQEKQHYYGQLVDMECQPFELVISDSATSVSEAFAHEYAKL